MIASFNDTALALNLSPDQMCAVQGDLLGAPTSPTLQRDEFFNFDVAVISMALHHVADPQAMTTKLVERLREGGSLLIIDWATDPAHADEGFGEVLDHHNHPDGYTKERLEEVQKTMIRAGFARDEMIELLRKAGCSQVYFALHPEPSVLPIKFGGEKRLFFARGRK
jgi:SAM-dependent methyltransferase